MCTMLPVCCKNGLLHSTFAFPSYETEYSISLFERDIRIKPLQYIYYKNCISVEHSLFPWNFLHNFVTESSSYPLFSNVKQTFFLYISFKKRCTGTQTKLHGGTYTQGKRIRKCVCLCTTYEVRCTIWEIPALARD